MSMFVIYLGGKNVFYGIYLVEGAGGHKFNAFKNRELWLPREYSVTAIVTVTVAEAK